jgi:type IV pilus biogenesis protein CpaD/CtpE
LRGRLIDLRQEEKLKSTVKTVTTAGILIGLAGCASTPPPTVQTGPDAEVTAEGLHRVDNSAMAMAWVKPDLNLQGYTKLMIDEVTVAYQKEPRATTQSPGSSEDNFALIPSQMANLKS